MNGFQRAIQEHKNKRKKVAEDIAMVLEKSAKLNAPVDKGHLRRNTNSKTTHKDTKSEITIATNGVDYARVVHEGSVVKNIKGQPYIKDALQQNMATIKTMIKEGME